MKLAARIPVLFIALPLAGGPSGRRLCDIGQAGDTPMLYVLATSPGGTVTKDAILMPGGSSQLDLRMEGSNIAMNGTSIAFTIRTRSLSSDRGTRSIKDPADG